MAHEIEKNDDMFSVRERPWHGLGDILKDAPSVKEARKNYLTWEAGLYPMSADVETTVNGQFITEHHRVPNKFAVLREDTKNVIGVVGSRYTIYQNTDMWNFIEQFVNKTKMTLETAGSLRNGETTWVLGKGDAFEVVKNDPINKYFLFRNAFNGSTPISTLFTNIRVVCNNTLSFALKEAKNIYNVRHVGDVITQMAEVERALLVQTKYQDTTKEVLTILKDKSMTDNTMRVMLEDTIFPLPKDTNKVMSSGIISGKIIPFADITARYLKMRRRKINTIMELTETGAGTDIPGVRGTAYGLYQALIEWMDHDKIVRPGILRTVEEARFENALFSTQDFKTDCIIKLLKAA